MADVSVTGASYHTALTPSEAGAAQLVLSPYLAPNVVSGVGGSSLEVVGSGGAAIITDVNGNTASTLVGDGNRDVLLGNQGNDTYVLHGPGYVFGGDGNNTVTGTFTGNTAVVNFGNGNNSITLDGAHVTVGSGNNTIDIAHVGFVTVGGGDNAVSIGGNGATHDGGAFTDANTLGNDTLMLGDGRYIVQEAGTAQISGTFTAGVFTATVSGGQFNFVDNGKFEGVRVLTANATVVAGTTGFEIFGSSGNNVFSGAAGSDTFVGGAGNMTVDGGGGNDLFAFGGQNGAANVINNFVAGDQIQLHGLTAAEASSHAVFNGTDTIITDGKTVITVAGQDVTGASNFKNG